MERPLIGVGVIIKRDNQVLLGQRKNSHGEGMWGLVGGHLEGGESIEDCANREVLEETGLLVNNFQIGPYTNDIFKEEKKHYVTLFVTVEYIGGEPQILEPEKCARWQWFEWNNLPTPLFLPIRNLVKTGFNPFL